MELKYKTTKAYFVCGTSTHMTFDVANSTVRAVSRTLRILSTVSSAQPARRA